MAGYGEITIHTHPTPRTDEVLREENNFGAYPGTDGMDGVTAQEAHDACFSNLAHLARSLERELEKCNDDWNKRYQQWGATEDRLRAEIKSLQRFKASVDEALNTGNGTYKP